MNNEKYAAENKRYTYFHKNPLIGVEIKQCKGNPHDFKSHVHAELSIGYIISGSTELCLHDRNIYIGAGDGVIIPPLVSHRCSPHDIHQWEYVMMYVQPDRYRDIIGFHRTRKLNGNAVHQLTGYIAQLLAQPNPDVLETTLLELLLEFGETEKPDAEDAGAIAYVHDYITAHIYDNITLDDLERISGLNKFTLIRNFKKTYVTTPASFHLQCRVAEAKKRLYTGSDVLTLCSDLHFYDQAHLIREFRRMYGITPNAYIKQISE